MKKILALSLLILFVQAQVLAATVPAGTLVVIQPQKIIDADDVKIGDTVFFTVKEPVKVKGDVVIKIGTEVTGTVVQRKNNGILGIPGEIEVGDFQIRMQDNETVRLRGSIQDKGEQRYWANVGWFFLFPLLFIKGNDGKIMKNTTHMLYTAEDINL